LFLLDTNVCIDFALGRSDPVRDRIFTSYGRGLGISAITLAELRVGARKQHAEATDEQKLDTLVRTLKLHPFDEAAADIYGDVARQIGIKRHSFDRLIGAHALSLGLILVTNNEADFADIPGLRVENWAI